MTSTPPGLPEYRGMTMRCGCTCGCTRVTTLAAFCADPVELRTRFERYIGQLGWRLSRLAPRWLCGDCAVAPCDKMPELHRGTAQPAIDSTLLTSTSPDADDRVERQPSTNP